MTDREPVVRAARLVVIDELGEVLLFKYLAADGPCWATPGGRLEPGEDFAAAAEREAWEELELRASPTLVLRDEHVVFRGIDTTEVRHQRFFRVDVVRGELPAGHEVAQRRRDEGVLEVRWWPRDALAHTTETVYPADLAEYLTRGSGNATRTG